jgi:hypothetical protein
VKTIITTTDEEGKVVSQQVSELSPHSIEVSRTTRGYTWTIKIYYADGGEEQAIANIKLIDDLLRQEFFTNSPEAKTDEFLAEATAHLDKGGR